MEPQTQGTPWKFDIPHKPDVPTRNAITKHHLTPKRRGGSKKDQTNILRLKYNDHHHPWHILFGAQTLEETIIMLLELVQQSFKEDPLEEHLFVAHSIQKQERRRGAWRKLFGDHTIKEVIDRLIRLKRLKCRKNYLRTILHLYTHTFNSDGQIRVIRKKNRRERASHRPDPTQFVLRQHSHA